MEGIDPGTSRIEGKRAYHWATAHIMQPLQLQDVYVETSKEKLYNGLGLTSLYRRRAFYRLLYFYNINI